VENCCERQQSEACRGAYGVIKCDYVSIANDRCAGGFSFTKAKSAKLRQRSFICAPKRRPTRASVYHRIRPLPFRSVRLTIPQPTTTLPYTRKRSSPRAPYAHSVAEAYGAVGSIVSGALRRFSNKPLHEIQLFLSNVADNDAPSLTSATARRTPPHCALPRSSTAHAGQ
jgi:hypothetical protein